MHCILDQTISLVPFQLILAPKERPVGLYVSDFDVVSPTNMVKSFPNLFFSRRSIGFLILGQNEFTGTIPNGMSLTSMFHMDLSFNQLTGTLPADIGENFNHLRQLYLDHNQFTGTIPETYPLAGGGRLYVLALDNNQVRCLLGIVSCCLIFVILSPPSLFLQLTGGVPTGWDKDNLFLDTLTVQGNQLTEPIDKEICKLSALENGELVQVGAECAICTCSVLCDNCY